MSVKDKIIADILHWNGLNESHLEELMAEADALEFERPSGTSEMLANFKRFKDECLPILVWGDYDCDGMTGAGVLSHFLNENEFVCDVHIPDRHQGYGVNPEILKEYIDRGYKVLITADCGITAFEGIKMAHDAGMYVVITDHHEFTEQLPEADFILHPGVLQIDSHRDLSGSGTAYWFCQLLKEIINNDYSCDEQMLTLAAIGAIADLVPVRRLNRQLIKLGLKTMKETTMPWLLELLKVSGTDKRELDAECLAFRIIPRLNAAGRMKSAQLAFDLLTSFETGKFEIEKCQALAAELDELNQQRRALTQLWTERAMDRVDFSLPAIVYHDDIPHGIAGLIASSLVNISNKPSFVCSDQGDFFKGSARTPLGYSTIDGLRYAKDSLMAFGGHPMASGFSFHKHHLEMFAWGIHEFYSMTERTKEDMQPLVFDHPQEHATEVLQATEMMQPFGPSLLKPIYAMQGEVEKAFLVKGQHLFLTFNGYKGVQWFSKCTDGCYNEIKQVHFVVGKDTKPKTPQMRLDIKNLGQ